LHPFADLAGIDATLQALATHEDGPFVVQLAREPGRKESRWRDLLQEPAEPDGVASADPSGPDVAEVTPGADLAARVAALEAEVARLGARLDGLANDARQ
jgi:uncharacterized protein YceH (UPF0502 family)